MRKEFIIVVLVLTISLAAQPLNILFENNTAEGIDELFIAIPGNEWSENLLSGKISAWNSLDLTYDDGSQYCNYSFLAIGDQGNTFLIDEINLCETDVVTLNDSYFVGNYQKPEYADDYEEQVIDGAIEDVITYSTWKIMVNGEDYGSLKLNGDNSCLKTGAGGILPTNGTWKLDSTGSIITLHFPDEGPAFEGKLNYINGSRMDLSFYDGAIVWNLTAM